MKPVPQYRASCRFVYAPCAVLTNSVGTVSRTPDYSGDRSHIVSRLNVYATLLGFKRAVEETCVKSCLQYGVAQDKVARAIDTVELSMVDDSIPLFEVAAISDDKRVATDVVRCYIDMLAQFDQLEQEERVAEVTIIDDAGESVIFSGKVENFLHPCETMANDAYRIKMTEVKKVLNFNNDKLFIFI